MTAGRPGNRLVAVTKRSCSVSATASPPLLIHQRDEVSERVELAHFVRVERDAERRFQMSRDFDRRDRVEHAAGPQGRVVLEFLRRRVRQEFGEDIALQPAWISSSLIVAKRVQGESQLKRDLPLVQGGKHLAGDVAVG